MNNSVTVKCPHCNTVRTGNTLRNSQFTCRGCGAVISVDNDGNIRWTKPKKG